MSASAVPRATSTTPGCSTAPRDGDERRTGIVRRTLAAEGLGPQSGDHRHMGQGLRVVDQRWRSAQAQGSPLVGSERRKRPTGLDPAAPMPTPRRQRNGQAVAPTARQPEPSPRQPAVPGHVRSPPPPARVRQARRRTPVRLPSLPPGAALRRAPGGVTEAEGACPCRWPVRPPSRSRGWCRRGPPRGRAPP